MLLIPTYHSTDFEVHRNWLAITAQLPLKKWYFEDRSEWTLDYPPFFAYFEWILSLVARYFDSDMLMVDNLNYKSYWTIIFMRFSVIVTELVYFYGCFSVANMLGITKGQKLYLLGLITCIPGLLFVDHIHFQYNGFLYGLQLLSLASFYRGQTLLGGFWFAALLNFKHIYLYQAPAYFVYILSSFCIQNGRLRLLNLVKMGLVVSFVFIASFYPFSDHVAQVIARLFPFKRGLCHAYWAPNVWAIYSFVDRLMISFLKILGKRITSTAHLTRGLVGDSTFAILPTITPFQTVLLTILSQFPSLWSLWKFPTINNFIRTLVLTGFGSFLFGWHVHEKAILMVLIPLGFLVPKSPAFAKLFTFANIVATFSLFPLIFEKNETITKTLVWLAYWQVSTTLTKLFHDWEWHPLEKLYLLGIIVLHSYTTFVHQWLFSKNLEFLPLMLTSVYSALGILYTWIVICKTDTH